ncbi:DUF3854 domain-containing protein [Oculatella sp. LEGE 06141]|uniref:plasmid replication protein, CyRepA1 family n=1 Tax=Oculatella sp. LEGE 06141 TaxID=1828648 RepID=UPI00187DDDC2|nr:plasmid replication protein, CyRepA1 family [Oculatella sp. LEGE 06141]MBE9178647.1 DUF3854 domain-containing protein [Oculatella sp. LEGE 06141]
MTSTTRFTTELDRIDLQAIKPDHITVKHWNEWCVESAVDPDITRLNIRSISDLEVDPVTREVSTPIADLLNWRYTRFGQRAKTNLEGWLCQGVDPLNNCQPMDWVRFKPNLPLLDENGKPKRYLAPKNVSSRATFLRVSWKAGLKIARSLGHEEVYVKRILQAHQGSEAETQSRETHPAIEEIGNFSDAVLHSGAGRVASSVLPAGSALQHEDPDFWEWVFTNGLPITLTEGEKKAGCLLTQGVVAIALPGITMGARSKDEHGNPCLPRLIPELEHFATKDREWLICFDYETKAKTAWAVRRETEKLCRLAQLAGCTAKVVPLPGPEKGVDDFIVAQGAEAFRSCYEAALPHEVWQIEHYTKLSHTPTLELNQRYLGAMCLLNNPKLLAIKSPKGTGKTESFVELVSEAVQTGQRVLLLTHRTQLGQAICDRIGIDFVSEIRVSETRGLLGYGLCLDSLHPGSQARFDAEHWNDAIVIIDECEQVFWHLFSAETEISKHRIAVLRQLRQLLINTLESDRGMVILSDADLSDLSIEFVQKHTEIRTAPYLIVNHWRPGSEQSWEIYHYSQTEPTEWYNSLVGAIAQGGHHFVCTHSQRTKSRWSTCTMESHLRRRFPDKRILRIDSKSIGDKTHPAYGCISRLNEIVGNYDIILASPSIETGVSVDIKGHFTAVWGCFQGCTPENTVRQSLARVREPVERHIWIAKHGLGKVGSGATSPQALLKSQQKMAQASLKLVDLDFDSTTGEFFSHHAALNTWAKMAARINIGMIRYREVVLYGLRGEGHQIFEFGWKVDRSELKEEITAVRDEEYLKEREAITTADEITPSQYETLKSQKNKRMEEWHKERKHKLQQRYGSEVTPELIEKDDKGWHPQIRLHYYLVYGRQFLKDRDRAVVDAAVQSHEIWLPSLNHAQLGVQIGALEFLGIPQLLDPNREFRCTDADLIEFAKKAKAHAYDLKTVLNVTISQKDTPIAIVQTLLGKIGQRLTYDRREGSRGNRVRVYLYRPARDGRDEVYLRWIERDQIKSQSAVSSPGIDQITA